MKIETQQEEFRPITITLETSNEVRALWWILASDVDKLNTEIHGQETVNSLASLERFLNGYGLKFRNK